MATQLLAMYLHDLWYHITQQVVQPEVLVHTMLAAGLQCVLCVSVA